MSGKSQTIGDFVVSQILLTWHQGMAVDKPRTPELFLFSLSVLTYENIHFDCLETWVPGTGGKRWNHWSYGIFPTYENQAEQVLYIILFFRDAFPISCLHDVSPAEFLMNPSRRQRNGKGFSRPRNGDFSSVFASECYNGVHFDHVLVHFRATSSLV